MTSWDSRRVHVTSKDFTRFSRLLSWSLHCSTHDWKTIKNAIILYTGIRRELSRSKNFPYVCMIFQFLRTFLTALWKIILPNHVLSIRNLSIQNFKQNLSLIEANHNVYFQQRREADPSQQNTVDKRKFERFKISYTFIVHSYLVFPRITSPTLKNRQMLGYAFTEPDVNGIHLEDNYPLCHFLYLQEIYQPLKFYG